MASELPSWKKISQSDEFLELDETRQLQALTGYSSRLSDQIDEQEDSEKRQEDQIKLSRFFQEESSKLNRRILLNDIIDGQLESGSQVTPMSVMKEFEELIAGVSVFRARRNQPSGIQGMRRRLPSPDTVKFLRNNSERIQLLENLESNERKSRDAFGTQFETLPIGVSESAQTSIQFRRAPHLKKRGLIEIAFPNGDTVFHDFGREVTRKDVIEFAVNDENISRFPDQSSIIGDDAARILQGAVQSADRMSQGVEFLTRNIFSEIGIRSAMVANAAQDALSGDISAESILDDAESLERFIQEERDAATRLLKEDGPLSGIEQDIVDALKTNPRLDAQAQRGGFRNILQSAEEGVGQVGVNLVTGVVTTLVAGPQAGATVLFYGNLGEQGLVAAQDALDHGATPKEAFDAFVIVGGSSGALETLGEVAFARMATPLFSELFRKAAPAKFKGFISGFARGAGTQTAIEVPTELAQNASANLYAAEYYDNNREIFGDVPRDVAVVMLTTILTGGVTGGARGITENFDAAVERRTKQLQGVKPLDKVLTEEDVVASLREQAGRTDPQETDSESNLVEPAEVIESQEPEEADQPAVGRQDQSQEVSDAPINAADAISSSDGELTGRFTEDGELVSGQILPADESGRVSVAGRRVDPSQIEQVIDDQGQVIFEADRGAEISTDLERRRQLEDLASELASESLPADTQGDRASEIGRSVVNLVESFSSGIGSSLQDFLSRNTFVRGDSDSIAIPSEARGSNISTDFGSISNVFTGIASGSRGDASTLLHEIAHGFRRDLQESDRQEVARWGAIVSRDRELREGNTEQAQRFDQIVQSVNNGETFDFDQNSPERLQIEENFAVGFERFLADGTFENPTLQRIFQSLKEFISSIISPESRSQISDSELSNLASILNNVFVLPNSVAEPQASTQGLERSQPVREAGQAQGDQRQDQQIEAAADSDQTNTQGSNESAPNQAVAQPSNQQADGTGRTGQTLFQGAASVKPSTVVKGSQKKIRDSSLQIRSLVNNSLNKLVTATGSIKTEANKFVMDEVRRLLSDIATVGRENISEIKRIESEAAALARDAKKQSKSQEAEQRRARSDEIKASNEALQEAADNMKLALDSLLKQGALTGYLEARRIPNLIRQAIKVQKLSDTFELFDAINTAVENSNLAFVRRRKSEIEAAQKKAKRQGESSVKGQVNDAIEGMKAWLNSPIVRRKFSGIAKNADVLKLVKRLQVVKGEESLARWIEEASAVMRDVERFNNLSKSKELRRKLKARARSSTLQFADSEIIGGLTMLEPSRLCCIDYGKPTPKSGDSAEFVSGVVDSLRLYNEIAENQLSSSRGRKARHSREFISDFIQRASVEQERQRIDRAFRMYGDVQQDDRMSDHLEKFGLDLRPTTPPSTVVGIISRDMPLREITQRISAYESFLAEGETKESPTTRMLSSASELVSELSEISKSPEKPWGKSNQHFVDSILSLRLDDKSYGELQSISNIVLGIIENGDFSNAGYAEVLHDAEQAIDNIRGLAERFPDATAFNNHITGERELGEAANRLSSIQSQTRNLTQFTRGLASYREFGDAFMAAVTQKWRNNVARAEKKIIDFNARLLKVSDGIRTRTDDTDIGVFAFINQHRGGDAESRNAVAVESQALLRQSILNMKNSNSLPSKRATGFKQKIKDTLSLTQRQDLATLADHYVERYSQLTGRNILDPEQDVSTFEELVEGVKLPKRLRDVYDFWVAEAKAIEPDLKANTEAFKNSTFDSWVNYSPRKTRKVGRNESRDIDAHFINPSNFSPIESGYVNTRNTIGTRRYYNLSFASSIMSAYREMQMDIHTEKDTQVLSAVTSTDELHQVIGQENTSMIINRLRFTHVSDRSFGQDPFSDPNSVPSRGLMLIRSATRLFVRTQLNGVSQFPKQVIPIWSDLFAKEPKAFSYVVSHDSELFSELESGRGDSSSISTAMTDFLAENAPGLSIRAPSDVIDITGRLDRFEQDSTIAQFLNYGIGTSEKVSTLFTKPLVLGDHVASRHSVLTFYLGEMLRTGKMSDLSDDSVLNALQNPDAEAVQFALSEQDNQNNVSSGAERGTAFQPDVGSLPSIAINQLFTLRRQTVNNGLEFWRRVGNLVDTDINRAENLRWIMGYYAQSLTFNVTAHILRAAAISWAASTVANLDDLSEEDEEEWNSLYNRGFRSIANTVTDPFTMPAGIPGELVVEHATDDTFKFIDSAVKDNESFANELLGDGALAPPEGSSYVDPFFLRSQSSKSDIESFGTFGFAFDAARNGISFGAEATNFMVDPTGDNAKRAALSSFVILHSMGLFEKDAASVAKQALRKIERAEE